MWVAVIFLLFLGFGGPRPPPPTLPFSTENCTINRPQTNIKILNQTIDDNAYPYLYRISYLWYSPIGFCISFFGGWLLTIVFEYFNCEGTKAIYLDDEKKLINADLFSPPIARIIRDKNAQFIQNELKVKGFF